MARGGLFVGTGSLPDEGQIVELRFEAPSGGLVSLRGIVWWTTLNRMGLGESPGFGVRLIDANEAYEIFLGGLERGDPRA